MGITLTQALLVSILYWITTAPYLSLYSSNLNWPVVNGFFIGLIMGDPVTGTMLGGLLQTLNMAPSMVGQTVTMDLKMASFITIPMAMSSGLSAENIVTFAVPFTVLGAFIQPLTRTLNQIILNLADKAAEKADTRMYSFVATWVNALIQLPFYFGVMFVALYFGQDAMSYLLSIIPDWLMISFMTLAKFLPGIGFAMFLKSMNKKEYLPMFFMGFYIMYFFGAAGLSMIGVTIFGVLLAIMFVKPWEKKSTEEGV